MRAYSTADPPLPRLCLIAEGFASDRAEMDAEGVRNSVLRVVRAGVPWVQLRDHSVSDAVFLAVAHNLVTNLRNVRPEVLVSINARPAAAKALRAGLHLGRHGPPSASAISAIGNALSPVGVSAHSVDEVRQAVRDGAHYAFISPIFPTKTHPDAEPGGEALLRGAVASAGHMPVLALGGLTPERAASCRALGAYGAASLRALLQASDPESAVHRFLEAIA